MSLFRRHTHTHTLTLTSLLPLPLPLTGCWDRVHSNRPSFTDILKDLKLFRAEELFSASHEEFRTMQSTWRQAIQEKFDTLKKVEQVCRSGCGLCY